MTIQWKGVMPAVTTKFNDQDELDLEAFKVNIQAQLDAGVHGIVLRRYFRRSQHLKSELEKRTLVRETVSLCKRCRSCNHKYCRTIYKSGY